MAESFDWTRLNYGLEPPAFYTEYTVIEGDTLESIGMDQIGCAECWPEIQALNNLPDGAVLVAGQILRLPEIDISMPGATAGGSATAVEHL